MLEKIKNITNIRYTVEDGLIDCELEHSDYGIITFTASKDDCESDGRTIYENIINGIYGEIAAYVEPIVEVQETETTENVSL